MSKSSRVDSTHYRKTSDDGRTSYLYKQSESFLGSDTCVEIATHHRDGSTTAYERDESLHGIVFNEGWKRK